MDEAFHIFFVFITLLALNFSFVLRFLTFLRDGFCYVLLATCNRLVHPLFKDQPQFLYWSMIRPTDCEFLLQRERSSCIAIMIPVRLHQEISYSSNLMFSLSSFV